MAKQPQPVFVVGDRVLMPVLANPKNRTSAATKDVEGVVVAIEEVDEVNGWFIYSIKVEGEEKCYRRNAYFVADLNIRKAE